MKLGEKIKNLRALHNMTQDDLAKVCYVTRNAVSKWENNNGYPNIESIRLMCKYFKITIDELLNEELESNDVINITSNIIVDNQKTFKKLQYLLSGLFIICYPITQVLLREIVYYMDPTAVMAWGIVIAPFLIMLLSILSSLFIKYYHFGLLNGLIGFGLTILLDMIIDGFNSSMLLMHLVYYLCYLVMTSIVYSVKYQRIVFIPERVKGFINKFIEVKLKIKIKSEEKLRIITTLLIVTIIWFLILLINSIYEEIYDVPHYVLALALNGVPLLYIMIFSIIILLEIVLYISMKIKYKNEISKINNKFKEKSKKEKVLIILEIILPIILIILSTIKFKYIEKCNAEVCLLWIVYKYFSVFETINGFKIIPIIIYTYTLFYGLFSIKNDSKNHIKRMIFNLVLITVCFIITFVISLFIVNYYK